MESETDRQLLDQLRRGDQAAYEALFLRRYQQVYRAAYGLARSHEVAEDAAQEAFLALYRRPPTLGEEGSLVAWLCRVAINRGSNALRGARREEARAAHLTLPEAPDPFEVLLRNEDRDLVREALAQLPERQATILALRYAGLAYAEIAAVLSLAPGSIGTLLARAERAFTAAYAAISQEPVPAAAPMER